MYNENEKDEYLQNDDVDAEEREEDRIEPSDLLLLSANTDNENHTLIMTLFDDIDDLNSYNHHDYLLPFLPLALEWFDYSGRKQFVYFCENTFHYSSQMAMLICALSARAITLASTCGISM